MDGSLRVIIGDTRRHQDKLRNPPQPSDKSDLEKRLAIRKVENTINYEKMLYTN